MRIKNYLESIVIATVIVTVFSVIFALTPWAKVTPNWIPSVISLLIGAVIMVVRAIRLQKKTFRAVTSNSSFENS